MKMKVLTGVFGVCLCSAIGVVAAQTPAPAGQPATTQRQSTSTDAKVTVQGCLERSSSPTATPGATGTAGSASAFILSKAEKAPAAAGAAGGATANAAGGASQSANATAATYKLDADATKLTPHVGHKVEISGTIVPASSTGSTTAQSSGNATAGGTMASMTQTLKVDDVKMIAASCTQ
jgi:hypothetical protein